MARPRLASWNKNRLRGLLLLFFLALAIPTGILFQQAYSQLKWEAFHNHRLMAEELVDRINQQYARLIDIENARAFTDYAFLNVAGDAKDNVLQRSQLSRFPIRETIPGTIGYFQIDHKGRFSTPLLPVEKTAISRYGVGRTEWRHREKAQQEIHQLLSDNHMLANEKARKSALLRREKARTARQQNQAKERAEKSGLMALSNELKDLMDTSEMNEQVSQSSFDKLQSRSYDKSSSGDSAPKSRGIGKVDDLKLANPYEQRIKKEKRSASTQKMAKPAPKPKKSKRMLRKEQNVLPRAASAMPRTSPSEDQYRVSMFESEIDTLEFGVLDSGHIILYRKVWRDSQRYIQGILLKADEFISAVIRDSFYNTGVSLSSDLNIAYQGDILYSFDSNGDYNYRSSTAEQYGALLLHARLSTPFDQLEMIFSVNNLPSGPGGTILTWTAIVLLLVFCGGFFLMYRLGIRQITLARQQQDFVSAVSHELKTPLTSIRMYGEILREGWADEEKQKTYYDYIYDESERLTRLINNVLQLARMTRNDIHAELSPCSVSQLLDNLRSKVQSQVDHAGFKLAINCDDKVANQNIDVDADYFSQIIINIVDNAIKFSNKSENKQIDITCHQLRDGQIQIGLRDYGPGIPKDQLRKIFQLFYRTENELTRETVGTGIGLSLVQQLVHIMHGKVDVVNMDPGVEFRITFPCVSDKPE